jgi:predicted dehydrogenase/threonine dehydrogenase-like Zn-dependent dehydrogenase
MLNAGTPTGYSAAGRVIAVGDQVASFASGDLVACAGAGVANHAEFIDVPVNLAVRLPGGLGTGEGCTVALGAIALQGVRRAAPTLGETFLVIGLGFLGQITHQLLRIHGCRVIGTDIDVRRTDVARSLGLAFGIDGREPDMAARVGDLTGGQGADGVIITAAAADNSGIVASAMRCCRRKGRVVIVGDVGLDLRRHEFYGKELDVLISCSYGPGRYDPSYESEGQDYPLPYVRWTENRNMEEYVRLLAEARIDLRRLQPKLYPLEQAPEAYASLQGAGEKPMVVILEYPTGPQNPAKTIALSHDRVSRKPGRIGVACVGAGGFAQLTHLPNLLKQRGRYELRAICSRTGATAVAAAKQFGAPKATTDFAEVLRDPSVDLVIICTRHDLHASMALEALRAGKHVLCEKPLALADGEIDAIEDFYAAPGPKPVLMVGFNRRWSPAFRRVRELVARRSAPLTAQYTMNAGYLPLEHWVHGPEGGGRNVGEACHVYDLFFALTGSHCTDLQLAGIPAQGRQWARNDNFAATLSFADGSVCSLLYTAMGAKAFPKERLQVFSEGRVIVLDDYKSVAVHGAAAKGWSGFMPDKGHLAELAVLADMIDKGVPDGFVAELAEVSRVAIEAERRLMRRELEGAA